MGCSSPLEWAAQGAGFLLPGNFGGRWPLCFPFEQSPAPRSKPGNPIRTREIPESGAAFSRLLGASAAQILRTTPPNQQHPKPTLAGPTAESAPHRSTPQNPPRPAQRPPEKPETKISVNVGRQGRHFGAPGLQARRLIFSFRLKHAAFAGDSAWPAGCPAVRGFASRGQPHPPRSVRSLFLEAPHLKTVSAAVRVAGIEATPAWKSKIQAAARR